MKRECFFLVLVLCSFSNLSLSREPNYGILTDDYGIVTEEDLQKEAEIAEPQPIIEEFSPFMVWQCLPLVEVSMDCDPTGGEIAPGDPVMDAILRIFDGQRLFEFFPRRPWAQDACDETVTEWQNILEGEDIACVSASYGRDLPVSASDPWKRHSAWTINRVKSHKGSWSYFIEEDEF